MLPLRQLFFVALFFVVAIFGFFVWAKMPYTYPEVQQQAIRFLKHLDAGEFRDAYAMTTQSGEMGKSLPEFRNRFPSLARFKKPFRVDSVSPLQSNGNRLRRWLGGQAQNPEIVHLEMAGTACSVTIIFARSVSTWKLQRVASHAC